MHVVTSSLRPRGSYLDWLTRFKDAEQIKIITGVRRSGKSYLLQLFNQHLEQSGIDPSRIISMNFEDYSLLNFKDPAVLHEYLQQTYSTDGKLYFLFDEIQEVKDWQRFINSLRINFDADIYLTGSNAAMLSGELSTYLAGRYVRMEMMPLGFREYCEFTDQATTDFSTNSAPLNDYIRYGGFPGVALTENVASKQNILHEIAESILMRDVAIRGGVDDFDVLVRLVSFLLDNIGQRVALTKIENTFAHHHRPVSLKTVSKLLRLLESAYLFYRCERFDLRGRERLVSTPKYYAVDSGLRNQVLGTFGGNLGGQLENVVYLELKRLGYEIYTGKLDSKEIDFYATKDGQVRYIQVAYSLPSNTHETDNLLRINDNFQKIVITQDWASVGMISGIPIIHISDFLVNGFPPY